MKHGKFYTMKKRNRDKYYQDVLDFCRTHRNDIPIDEFQSHLSYLNHRIWLLYYVGLLETWDIISETAKSNE